ncbi:MAG: hypothetical protein ACLFXM_12020 [Acidimicrobiia bacterium]
MQRPATASPATVGRPPGQPPAGAPSAARRGTEPPSAGGRWVLSDRALALVTAVLALPLVWLGYGTDIDIAAVRETGELIRSGDYAPSRNPGVPVFEAVVAALDPIGHVAINLATAGALVAGVLAIARLVRTAGHPHGDLVALAFLASPLALVAGTSTVDFVWALAFALWALVALWHDRSVLAGILFALGIGSRSSTALLAAAVLIADAWVPAHRRRALVAGAVALPLAAALYVPAWLSFDRTLEFLSHDEGYRSFANNLGRFAYKNVSFAGIALIVAVALLLPALLRSLRRWRTDGLVRAGVLALVATEALFFVVPWKVGHLLPSLVALLLWIGATDQRRRVLWLLVGAVALNGLVAVRALRPDRPDESTGASVDPAVTAGWLVNDIRCRVEVMDEEPATDSGAWSCHLEPMRGEVDEPRE